jgi:hypothetical protein
MELTNDELIWCFSTLSADDQHEPDTYITMPTQAFASQKWEHYSVV